MRLSKIYCNLLRSRLVNIDIILYYPHDDYLYFLDNHPSFARKEEIALPRMYEKNPYERFVIYRLTIKASSSKLSLEDSNVSEKKNDENTHVIHYNKYGMCFYEKGVSLTMKKITFTDIHTIGHVIAENELYKQVHYPEMLNRYDSNFIEFKKMPSLDEFIDTADYLRAFHLSKWSKTCEILFTCE